MDPSLLPPLLRAAPAAIASLDLTGRILDVNPALVEQSPLSIQILPPSGISAAVLPFIFERFTQGDSSPTRAHSGLGLGLAIVRHLVELHGGTVTASSAGRGQGATFRIFVPRPVDPVDLGGTGQP